MADGFLACSTIDLLHEVAYYLIPDNELQQCTLTRKFYL